MITKILKLNYLLIFILLLLSIIGIAGLYSAAEANFSPWANKHLFRFIIFFFLMIIISLTNLKFFYKYAYLIFFLSLSLLFYIEIAGSFGNGAERWIRIFGISIQPSELMKVALIIALARYYHDLNFVRIGKIHNLFFPIFFITIPFFLITIQPDLGTALSVFILGVLIMFIAGVRLWKFITGLAVFVGLLPVFWNIIEPYQQKRIFSFLNPETDPLGQGYQLIQSKIALGSGGLFGKGFLSGTQAYLEFLPEKQTDFIFTLIGEEFGFIGTIFVIILFIILIFICFYIGFKTFHVFGKILCIGIACNLFLYVVMNIAMVSGLMPIVGIPLPLLSYGGTAMLAIMIAFGLVLNVELNYNLKKLNS